MIAWAFGPVAEAKTLTFWQFWPESWLRPELNKFEAETGIKVEVERLTWSEGLTNGPRERDGG